MKENTNEILETNDSSETEQPESEIKQVSIESLQAELNEAKDQWLRTVAEMENIRKRAQKEKEDALRYAISNFAREILPVADNLRRALESCEMSDALPESTKSLIAGVQMTEQELLKAFENHGLKVVTPLNQKFDPNFHQAVFEIENSEVESGTVLQVMQSGYVLHERLLRPAMVGVSKGGSSKTDFTV